MNDDIIEQINEIRDDIAVSCNNIQDTIDEMHILVEQMKEDIKALKNESK